MQLSHMTMETLPTGSMIHCHGSMNIYVYLKPASKCPTDVIMGYVLKNAEYGDPTGYGAMAFNFERLIEHAIHSLYSRKAPLSIYLHLIQVAMDERRWNI